MAKIKAYVENWIMKMSRIQDVEGYFSVSKYGQ
jgi:hypothetical protein